MTHKGPQFCQDVGHGGVGFVVLLRLGKRPPRHIDEPRCDDGEHVELLARVRRQVWTGDEVMPARRKQRGLKGFPSLCTLKNIKSAQTLETSLDFILFLCNTLSGLIDQSTENNRIKIKN